MCLFLQDESRRSQDSLRIGGLDSPSKVVKEFSFKCKYISLTDRAVPMLKLLNFKFFIKLHLWRESLLIAAQVQQSKSL